MDFLIPLGGINFATEYPSQLNILGTILKGESTAAKKLEVPSIRLLASSMQSARANFVPVASD
jgi:hypothetical protein